MANLKINGKAIDKDATILFGDFIRHLNKDLSAASQVVSTIKIDGKFVDEVTETNLSTMPLGQMGQIDITTADPIELAFEALAAARLYIKKIIPHSKITGSYYKEKNMPKGDRHFLELIDGLENLVNIIISSQSFLRGKFKGALRNDSSLRISQVRLVSAIEELLPAKKANDYVMLADVLCSELPEALQEMADYGIPVLQRLKNIKQ